MYLSIGADYALRDSSVIGIFDLENTSVSRFTRAFLREAEQRGEVLALTGELPKSFILTEEYDMDRVVLTQIGSAALEKRNPNGWIAHVCIECHHIDEVVADLKARGIIPETAQVSYSDQILGGIKNIFFDGPSGEAIELFDYLRD